MATTKATAADAGATSADAGTQAEEQVKASAAVAEDKTADAEDIIRKHCYAAAGVGLIPIPWVDFIGLTAIQMKMLHQQQIKCVEHVDTVLAGLLDKAPANTHFVITADHGECFGEGGFFGHGPIVHDKVLEVPFLEGRKK